MLLPSFLSSDLFLPKTTVAVNFILKFNPPSTSNPLLAQSNTTTTYITVNRPAQFSSLFVTKVPSLHQSMSRLAVSFQLLSTTSCGRLPFQLQSQKIQLGSMTDCAILFNSSVATTDAARRTMKMVVCVCVRSVRD